MTTVSCKDKDKDSNDKDGVESATTVFDELCDTMFKQYFEDDPISVHYTLEKPENYGIKIDNYTLGDLTEDSIKDSEKEVTDNLNALNKININDLDKDRQLTYKVIKEYLVTQDNYIGTSQLNNLFAPSSGVISNLSTTFIEFKFDSKDDVDMYLALVKDTERYMDQLFDYTRQQSEDGYFMPDYVANQVIDQCEQYIEADKNPMILTFDDKINELSLTDEEKKDYITTNKQYVEAYYDPVYQETIDLMKELKGTGKNDGGLCKYGDTGVKYYNAILRDKTSSSMTGDKIIDMLDDEMQEIIQKFSMLYVKNPDAVNNATTYKPTEREPKDILDQLVKDLKKDFPEAVTDSFKVEYQNKAVEIDGTIAYYLTARIDDISYNSIKVNGSAVENDPMMLYTTLAHEGYPGHLYMFTNLFNNKEIPNIRKVLDFIGYTEGWAEYASEKAVYYLDIDEDLATAINLNELYNYLLCSRVDLGVNYEGWDKSDLQSYLSDYGLSDTETITDLYYTVIGDPGLYLPYTIGHIKMNDYRERAEDSLNDKFDAVDFNQMLLNVGAAPFDVVDEYVKTYIDSYSK